MNAETGSLSYVSLKNTYIDKVKQRIGRLDSKLDDIREEDLKKSDDLIALTYSMKHEKTMLEQALGELERTSQDLWKWTLVVDEIEQVWERVCRCLKRVREVEEEDERGLVERTLFRADDF